MRHDYGMWAVPVGIAYQQVHGSTLPLPWREGSRGGQNFIPAKPAGLFPKPFPCFTAHHYPRPHSIPPSRAQIALDVIAAQAETDCRVKDPGLHHSDVRADFLQKVIAAVRKPFRRYAYPQPVYSGRGFGGLSMPKSLILRYSKVRWMLNVSAARDLFWLASASACSMAYFSAARI